MNKITKLNHETMLCGAVTELIVLKASAHSVDMESANQIRNAVNSVCDILNTYGYLNNEGFNLARCAAEGISYGAQ